MCIPRPGFSSSPGTRWASVIGAMLIAAGSSTVAMGSTDEPKDVAPLAAAPVTGSTSNAPSMSDLGSKPGTGSSWSPDMPKSSQSVLSPLGSDHELMTAIQAQKELDRRKREREKSADLERQRAAMSSDGVAAPLEDENGEALNYLGNKPEAANVRYFEDFEGDEPGREWSIDGRLSRLSEFSRFVGPLRNSTETLNLKVNPGQAYLVQFDVHFIASMLASPEASDTMQVLVDGQVMFEETFASLQDRNKETNEGLPDFDESTFRQITVPFTPQFRIAEIRFVSKATGLPGGESWGLDNVLVDTAPDPTYGEIGGGGIRDIIASGMVEEVFGGNGSNVRDYSSNLNGSSESPGLHDRPRFRLPPQPPDEEPPDEQPPPEDPPTPPGPPGPEPPPPRNPPTDNPPPENPPPPTPPPENPPPPPPPPHEPPVPAPGTVLIMGFGGLMASGRRRTN